MFLRYPNTKGKENAMNSNNQKDKWKNTERASSIPEDELKNATGGGWWKDIEKVVEYGDTAAYLLGVSCSVCGKKNCEEHGKK